MTRQIIIFLAIIIFNDIHGRCSDTHLIWPTTEKINCNTIFIFEESIGTYTKDLKEKIPVELLPKKGLLLKHGKDTIRLDIVSNISNKFGFSQIIVKPRRNLKPNTKYRFVTYNDKNELIYFDIIIGRKYWETNNFTDNSNPILSKAPIFIEDKTCYNESFEHCHDAVFKFKAKDKSKCVIKLTIVNSSDGSSNEIICFPHKGLIYIGMNECYYGYEFRLGQEYEITFQLIDSSNNLSTEIHTIKYKRQK